MKKNNYASVLIYAIILTMVALTLATILMNNQTTLILNIKQNYIEKKLKQNINNKVNLFSEILKDTNNDGSGFIDILEGSGANISCRLQADGTYLLEGDDGTKTGSDNIDDNCNSDNYLGNNSGSTDYPNNFEDNDNYIRKNINGFIIPNTNNNIFWSNYKIKKYIEDNPNNTDSYNVKLGNTQSGALFLTISTGALITIYKLDTDLYKNIKKFKKIETLTGTLVSGSGYLSINSGNIILDSNIDNYYNFDFINYDYLIFLKNLDNSKILTYNLYAINKTDNKGIYINPINDSDPINFKILGYDVIIDEFNNLIGKNIEIIEKK